MNTKEQKLENYSIIQTGGKQYQAQEGKTIAIEKLNAKVGDKVEFKEVILRRAGDNIEIGKPFLSSSVKASILKHIRGPKVIAFMFKRRKKVATKKGHRQSMTIVRIESI